MANSYCLEVCGDFACFTRPEMKVERVSYEVITPSAARAIFEAIFWKPAIQWRITQIEVINPVNWISVRRNEVGKVFSGPSVKQLNGGNALAMGLIIEDERQQRSALFLREVKYRIFADLIFDQSKDPESKYAKYAEMFERRAKKGQCFNQPYLGCREFTCSFRMIEGSKNEPKPISDSRELGWMLYDMDYTKKENPTPRFFKAEMKNGVVEVPAWNSPEVRG